ncbi:hypothetical protein [Mariniplasma anaerobium]|uniref:Uncharacterized protein n=1 Tax=Mariniplasma anaerobium TaxID=2735436 RepID=A0A7U9XVS0_9MOLU|nr:hypothetical protein [Mariniplasma anaerobium]BCR36670.1 hypothetical protein MPAN_015630 [Mariniplasma anaerobium]
MRDKLKLLGLRLTELSDYLGFSRPTLYKYLEDYENKKYKAIDYKVKTVFDFIMKKKTLSKIEVINYIIDLNGDKKESNLDKLFKEIKDDDILTKRIIELIDKKGMNFVLNQIKIIVKKGDVKND